MGKNISFRVNGIKAWNWLQSTSHENIEEKKSNCPKNRHYFTFFLLISGWNVTWKCFWEIHLLVSYACHWGRLIYSSSEISGASLKQKEVGQSCVIALATIAILIFGNIDAVKVRVVWQYSRERFLSVMP